jgi:hypothetical protein
MVVDHPPLLSDFVRHIGIKKDQKAVLTGSATGTIGTNIYRSVLLCKFFNIYHIYQQHQSIREWYFNKENTLSFILALSFLYLLVIARDIWNGNIVFEIDLFIVLITDSLNKNIFISLLNFQL